MNDKPLSFREYLSWLAFKVSLRKYHVFPLARVELEDFEPGGLILDIGGGGEGVIGRLKGSQVVAIDLLQDELDEAPDGPQKIVMDARQLTFPEVHFGAATAFFSLMYMKTREDHQKVLAEAWRVLKPGGRLRIWELDLGDLSRVRKDKIFLPLRYRVGGVERGTGYGVRKPPEPRGEAYYLLLAGEAGFRHLGTSRSGQVLLLDFVKDR